MKLSKASVIRRSTPNNQQAAIGGPFLWELGNMNERVRRVSADVRYWHLADICSYAAALAVNQARVDAFIGLL